MASLEFDNAATPSPAAVFRRLLRTYLQSIVLKNAALAYDQENFLICTRRDYPNIPKINHGYAPGPSIIFCGEHPAYSVMATFVCRGLLSAYVYLSPIQTLAQAQILAAIRQVDKRCGVMFLTVDDDNLNASELDAAIAKAKARDPGLITAQVRLPVRSVLKRLDDDCFIDTDYDTISRLVLAVKVCAACAQRGYHVEQVAMLAGLVMKNTLSSSFTVPPDSEMEAAVGLRLRAELVSAETIRQTLKRMLDAEVRPRDFPEVNSNEPVLVVRFNNTDDFDPSVVGQVTKEVTRQLETEWNIHSVRTYSVPLLYMPVVRETGEFSISILNVVNTDIGGPGMPELLDDEIAHSLGWRTWVDGVPGMCGGHIIPWTPCNLKITTGIWVGAIISGLQALLDVGSTPIPERVRKYPVGHYFEDRMIIRTKLENHLRREMCSVATEYLKHISIFEKETSAKETNLLWLVEDLASMPEFRSTSFGSLCLIFLTAWLNSIEKQAETTDELNIGMWISSLEEALKIASSYITDNDGIYQKVRSPEDFLQVDGVSRAPVYYDDMVLLKAAMKTLRSTGRVWSMVEASHDICPHFADHTHLQLWTAFFRGVASYLEPPSPQAATGDAQAEVRDETSMTESETTEAADIRPTGPAGRNVGSETDNEVHRPELNTHEHKPRNSETTNTSSPILQVEHDSAAPPQPSTRAPGILASIGVVLGLTSPTTTSSTSPGHTGESAPSPSSNADTEQPAQPVHSEALPAPLVVDKSSQLPVRTRETVPRPGLQHVDERSLLDMIRGQVRTLERDRAREQKEVRKRTMKEGLEEGEEGAGEKVEQTETEMEKGDGEKDAVVEKRGEGTEDGEEDEDDDYEFV